MNNDRKAQIFKNNKWIDIKFEDLKKDDKFRLFESDGESVKDKNGYTEFIAINDSYINNKGIGTIDIND